MGAMAAPARDDDLVERVQAQLDAFVDAQRARLAAAGPEATALIGAAHRSVAGGKRLRAAYCYWGWRAAGGSPEDDRPVIAGSALEWLQASALVHDDVIDESDTRRGRPAAHRAFAARHRDRGFRGDARHFGVGAAVLLGDLMLSWADESFGACRAGTSGAAAAAHFDACKSEVVAGQFLDVVAEAAADPTVESAMRVVRYKAAKYTVERPLLIGATLAGAGRELVAALSGFGLPVGEAFQLRDDVLGALGDASVTGKPAGDDLRAGKRTVLVARAYERADPTQREVLDTLVGDGELAADGVDRVREIIRSTGALAAVEAHIADLYDAALHALDAAPLVDEAARKPLAELAERSVRRER
jgi:geranylgeranyl diphosphate synthase, type I